KFVNSLSDRLSSIIIFFFFFFQAEDGIRDRTVTGVQTCALPIFTHPLVKHKIGLIRELDISTKKFRELTNELARLLAYEATADRSEERRVGKECRSRWSPSH